MIKMIICIAYLALIVIGAALIRTAVSGGRKAEELAGRLSGLIKDCRSFCAYVLDVHRERVKMPDGKVKKIKVMILQFRIEEEKRTVIHKYTLPFFGKYKRGDPAELYFREQFPEDWALLADDNIYINLPRLTKRLKAPITAAGILCAAAGTSGIALLLAKMI